MSAAKTLGGIVIVFALIQFVPYGKSHTNPPVTGEPEWDSDRTKELFFRTCGDCHSNETVWPWYTSIAPASWLAQFDVEHGREYFNVSEWGRTGKNEGEEAAEEVRKGKMPPFFYLPLHPEANLDADEKQELIDGLVATFGEEKKHENE
ncbi:heme-binding domain-containing protein [Prosthecochloris sp. HL-130-GSB]|jgi:mono/diheme cytochrome c family protein|uniref:Cytochrome C n=1 Tax=Prosthecochloris aestuarii TaxID=1102 RepID=A0A831WRJ3_PROAE|nr:heme-binding domain-containing protein [Prosthecochloris sp. HL-130-GSB]ARM30349.1 cytochrome C [Prosthecochloris sp. HL-130-GSB]MBO8091978.1 heme-binding domain-containing protein [Prosthecochloris sp.]HED30835.1 cytochrome C [Prosthecochloris aestuarii]